MKRPYFRKQRILFVCLGNICRSPAAEGIMKHLLKVENLEHIAEVDSSGIGPWHVGQLPDERMRRHGRRHGYEFDSIARQFSAADFDRFDLIVGMDEDNVSQISSRARSPYDLHKVVCMADYLTHHPMHKSVPDPYYSNDNAFELVIELLEDACQGLLNSIK
ncbi:MAG: low molecular weight phosphotyrosine protein phosphatase [Prevotella sp.]|nr:low molecular weight phosphotyrosine protein phosphatase [Prevotella sp.]MBP5506865.1 low molecular weight phosphotyrosine protein phosphatase [Prevotella sp.]